jgi:hypothetical protein
MKPLTLAALVILILLAALPAAAHDPFIEHDEGWSSFKTPFVAPDAAISYALYGYLPKADSIDVFEYNLDKAEALLRVELLVPVCGAHYQNFYPQFIIAGPPTKDALKVELPFDLPEGMSVIYTSMPQKQAEATPEAKPDGKRPTFTEPFGGTIFYDGPSIDVKVPAAGTYYVVVFDPAGKGGDYTLATGYKEQFNSPREQVLRNVASVRTGEWLHRRCELSPDDPKAIIAHSHAD